MRKWHICFLLACFVLCLSASAEQSTPAKQSPVDTVKSITNPEIKKDRRKKVEMCAECGKPESECECKGHKDEEKEDKKADKKKN